MNTYGAFWNGQEMTVEADTLYGAQLAAIPVFQAKTRKKVKGGDVRVVLMALNGQTYTQPTDF
jgi:hypothetical protein